MGKTKDRAAYWRKSNDVILPKPEIRHAMLHIFLYDYVPGWIEVIEIDHSTYCARLFNEEGKLIETKIKTSLIEAQTWAETLFVALRIYEGG